MPICRSAKGKTRGALRAIAMVVAVLTAAIFALPAWGGTITAKVDSAEPITKAIAIHRNRTSGGMYSIPIEGKLADGKYVFVVEPGRYDLAFETASGRFEGWDTAVPRSDYEEEQPLGDESKQMILTKMGTETVCGFADEAYVIDLQGNIQHSAALLYELRTQPFTESMGENNRQWIYRVDRWEWECPDDETWTTNKETPYYALHRERIAKNGDKDLRITFARSLGGIVTTREKPDFDAGTMKLPKLTPGIHAMNPDGTLTDPIKVKPRVGKDGSKRKNTEPAMTQVSPRKSEKESQSPVDNASASPAVPSKTPPQAPASSEKASNSK